MQELATLKDISEFKEHIGKKLNHHPYIYTERVDFAAETAIVMHRDMKQTYQRGRLQHVT